MTTLTYDGNNVTLATKDGNTTQEADGATVKNSLISDVFGNTFDTDIYQEVDGSPLFTAFDPPDSASLTESGGSLTINWSNNNDGASPIKYKHYRALGKLSDGVMDVRLNFGTSTVNVTGTDPLPGDATSLTAMYLVKDVDNMMWVDIFIFGTSLKIRFVKTVAGSTTTVQEVGLGPPSGIGKIDSLRLRQDASNVWTASYEWNGGGETDFATTATQDYAADMYFAFSYGGRCPTSGGPVTVSHELTSWEQLAGGLYWGNQEATYDAQAHQGTIDFATFDAAAEVGTNKYDYGTGTDRTEAQMQALGEQTPASPMAITALLGSDAEYSNTQAAVAAITMDDAAGGPPVGTLALMGVGR